jgi:dienelactone hydrolase
MHRRTVSILTAAWLMCTTIAQAGLVTREVEYQQGETKLKGFLAKPKDIQGKRPGVIVVHEWWGHNEHARQAAQLLAEEGYVTFALDMYGDGKLATHPADAQAFMQEATQDPAVIAARFNAAREQLVSDPNVDSSKLGAIGYCFGGGVILGMVRSGAELRAVASFHGVLATDHPAEKGKVKAQVLVLTGADDPMVTAEQVEAFRQEMKAAGVKFRVVSYPGAKHSFTNPDAGTHGMEALAYNAEADKKSWAEMLKFFKKALK